MPDPACDYSVGGESSTGDTTLAFADETATPTHDRFVCNRPGAKAAGAEVAFVVDDVGLAYRHALAHGATAVVERVEKPWGQTVAYVRDLDGFLVELCTAVHG